MTDHIPLVMVSEKTAEPSAKRPLRLHTISSVVFLYPSVIMAIACGIGSGFGHRTTESPGKLGLIFTLFFFVNLTVITFEYTKKSSLTVIGFSLIMGILGWQSDLAARMMKGIFDQPLYMNATYYWIWGMFILGLIAFGWVISRLEHWRVEGDLFVRRSIFREQESHSVANLSVSVDINDVLEYALLRSGRITVCHGPGIPLVRLDHVMDVKRVSARLQAAFEEARRTMPHAVPVHPDPHMTPGYLDNTSVPLSTLPSPNESWGESATVPSEQVGVDSITSSEPLSSMPASSVSSSMVSESAPDSFETSSVSEHQNQGSSSSDEAL